MNYYPEEILTFPFFLTDSRSIGSSNSESMYGKASNTAPTEPAMLSGANTDFSILFRYPYKKNAYGQNVRVYEQNSRSTRKFDTNSTRKADGNWKEENRLNLPY